VAFGKFVNMELDDDEILRQITGAPIEVQKGNIPKYPWGLRLCFDSNAVTKLGLRDDCEVGEEFEAKVKGIITSVSSNQMESGKTEFRVEVQLQEIAVPEDEDDE
jgi:hypothetical protein